MIVHLKGIGVCLLTAAFALPQDAPDPLAAMKEAKPKGEFAVLLALEEIQDDVRGTAQEDLLMDLLATRFTYIHDEQESVRLDSLAYLAAKTRGAGAPSLDGFEPVPAVEAIVQLSRDRRVLMLNEEHRRSQERAFANELLVPLAEAGFTHLALETLNADEAALAQRGYPLTKDGYYTNDPALGDLVRRALALGMGVTGYEADLDDFPRELAGVPMGMANWREERQARNLADFVRDHPDARVVVWSGRHHMSEVAPSDEPGLWPMGGHFAALSGIDPLTVDLMVMKEADVPEREHPVYRAAADAGRVDAPTMFLDADGTPWSGIDSLDASVFLPRSTMDAGRPQWMRMGGLRHEVRVDVAELDDAPSPGRPFVIEARVDGELPDAVPLDRVLWREGEPPALLVRPELAYIVRVLAPLDEVLLEQRVGGG